MPQPVALCLEDLGSHHRSSRYVKCVALKGRQPGLGVDAHGEIAWHSDRALACELWVSADDQLILLRPSGAPAVSVERAGRCLDAPFGKPVVLLDQDIFETAGRRFRVHVHGAARSVSPPTPLVERPSVGRLAATVAIGMAALSCQKPGSGTSTPTSDPVEVRHSPPAVAIQMPADASAALPTDASATLPADASAALPSDAPSDSPADATAETATLDAGKRDAGKAKPKPIEVRNHPPDPIE